MDNKEKILELLEKPVLSEPEQLWLNKTLTTDPDANEFYQNYALIKNAVRKNSHISYDELYNYILFKNGNEPEDKSITVRAPLIESHLRRCSRCMTEFSVLNEEYAGIENFIAAPATVQAAPVKRNYLRYGAAAGLSVMVLYLVLFIVSEIVTPSTFLNAGVDESSFYITRGRGTSEFQLSLDALESKNYSEAIEYLKEDIQKNSDDESVFYSHYILGLTYLQSAEKSFLGLFPDYDQEKSSLALKHLKQSLAFNKSGRFANISFDAYFYIAKANLMMGNESEARSYLKRVVENKGSKMSEAQRILAELK